MVTDEIPSFYSWFPIAIVPNLVYLWGNHAHPRGAVSVAVSIPAAHLGSRCHNNRVGITISPLTTLRCCNLGSMSSILFLLHCSSPDAMDWAQLLNKSSLLKIHYSVTSWYVENQMLIKWNAIPCYYIISCIFLSHFIISFAILCYPFHTLLSHKIPWYPILFYVIMYILFHPTRCYPMPSHPILSCHILWYPMLSSYPILSYSILFYPII
jgi:hypothetical protein